MNHNENPYYRYESSGIYKVVQNHNNPLGISSQRYSTIGDRKMDVSKEKENDRVINLDKRVKRYTHQEEPKRISSNYLTFKTMAGIPSQAHITSTVQSTQPTEERRPKERKQSKVEVKEIARVSSTVSINAKKQVHETKATQPKIQLKQDDTKKNSEKRNNEPQRLRKTKEKEPSPNEFHCNEEMEIVQPKSSRLETQKSKPTLKTNIIHPIKHGIEKQISDFEQLEARINMQEHAQHILYLGSRQNTYCPDPNYIQKKQKNLSWFMRAILVEWMMHVSFEYRLKRDTFHLAVAVTDLYFSRCHHVAKNSLQLVGAAAMYMAAKIEEVQPLEVLKFAESTNGKYQSKQILEMEFKIFKVMKWELNPPTIAMWGNKIMQQWDLFLEESDYARNHPVVKQGKPIFFKKADQKSYNHFRQAMQIIDCCVLDIQSLQYKQKPLVCSVIYLVLKRVVENVPLKQIVEEYPRASYYLVDEDNIFNDLFRAFVEYTLGFMLLDLLPTVQYCSTFFNLQLTYQAPDMTPEQLKQSNFEQYSSYQTYNSNSLSLIKRRPRGIIQGIYAQ